MCLSKNSTSDPRDLKTSHIIPTSLRSGTSSNIISSVPNNDAAIMGSAEFFAPFILTVPFNGGLFSTTIISKLSPPTLVSCCNYRRTYPQVCIMFFFIIPHRKVNVNLFLINC